MPVTPAAITEFGLQHIEFEGATVVALAAPLSTTSVVEGDLCIVRRSWESLDCWELGTCEEFSMTELQWARIEGYPPYDLWDCFLVVDIIDSNTNT